MYPRKILGGQLTGVTTGTPVAEATQCLTDTFTITNQENLPVICGINSGYHVYFGKFHLCLFLTTCSSWTQVGGSWQISGFHMK